MSAIPWQQRREKYLKETQESKGIHLVWPILNESKRDAEERPAK